MKRKHGSEEAQQGHSTETCNNGPETGPSGSQTRSIFDPEPVAKQPAPAPAAESSPLSRAQKAQIERNRQRALMLRQARLREHPSQAALDGGCDGRVLRVQGTRLVDSGGGFFIDESESEAPAGPPPLREKPAPLHITDRPDCDECGAPVASSFLVDSFDWPVCDPCQKENSDKYALITRTEAKQEYILKDEDFDKREPELRFITRRNPHNPRWGQMKLYLRLQIEERALQVWGSEEELERQHELRDKKKEKIKVNKFNKRVKELRMAVRSSVYKRDLTGHEHTYGEEVHNDADDTYTRTCTECDHSQTYEKM
ncbi:DNA repair protein complementing XP-A cells homolog [Amphibalanus amphitrite]|uniref:DNA repair protein complementing XP-A cells homolog n=1 Tax=Amphibalanus amphitrite TaxID=1232801 RepID=UPI001C9102B5|nr:DNA repair protein complementing XP-A cells homolog [Amphibalanus amphitrite]XP_043236539.1 DNA repair protein complementing XP-A cells homolog [Amphibalanus amphitrite]XP_043236540.1 DNA repair protein complementing XP-A cells homolog [Amphibalanus amphitrite]XP_043236541.1 DNA repair protein complementing XP-A cells homolog [Amphibalanus amphitrite]XP_043236542.1 DNA repair protein complementing XP-A cells homolog [Amphibalanus amphitrite]XP_043236543.1 DNA repair protein complementing XP